MVPELGNFCIRYEGFYFSVIHVDIIGVGVFIPLSTLMEYKSIMKIE